MLSLSDISRWLRRHCSICRVKLPSGELDTMTGRYAALDTLAICAYLLYIPLLLTFRISDTPTRRLSMLDSYWFLTDTPLRPGRHYCGKTMACMPYHNITSGPRRTSRSNSPMICAFILARFSITVKSRRTYRHGFRLNNTATAEDRCHTPLLYHLNTFISYSYTLKSFTAILISNTYLLRCRRICTAFFWFLGKMIWWWARLL